MEDDWLCDLLKTDLAVLPIRDRTVGHGVRGLSLQNFFLQGVGDAWNSYPSVTVGDDVAMTGRFYPVSGGARNLPVCRFGNIARWPAAPVLLPKISEPQDVILAEMRSHSGYSGSPVFVFGGMHQAVSNMVQEALDPYRPKGYQDLDWPATMFLGINCGHLGGEHMAMIIPWFKVVELLKHPVLAEQRKKQDASLPPMGTYD